MIYTVTLNPAIDRTILMGMLIKGSVNRCKYSRLDVGGKGINISKLLIKLGEKNTALGFLGEKNYGYFLDNLIAMGINSDFNIIKGETRTNIKIIEDESKTFTDINDKGFTVNKMDEDNIINKVVKKSKRGDIVALGGSLPQGCSTDIYMRFIQKLKEKGVTTILDADGRVLKSGIEAKPNLIKPNLKELKNIVEYNEDSIESIAEAGQKVTKMGIERVIISMGDRGAILACQDAVYRAFPVPIEVYGTVGAGDFMLAGFIHGMRRRYNDIEKMRFAAACGTASVMNRGTEVPNTVIIRELKKKIRVDRII